MAQQPNKIRLFSLISTKSEVSHPVLAMILLCESPFRFSVPCLHSSETLRNLRLTFPLLKILAEEDSY